MLGFGVMDRNEYIDFDDFLKKRIYPEYGHQPTLFRHWDKQALRTLYVDFLKPQYRYLRNNPQLCYLINEVQQNLEGN